MDEELVSYNPKTQTAEEVRRLKLGVKRYLRECRVVTIRPAFAPGLFIVRLEKYDEEYVITREVMERDYSEL